MSTVYIGFTDMFQATGKDRFLNCNYISGISQHCAKQPSLPSFLFYLLCSFLHTISSLLFIVFGAVTSCFVPTVVSYPVVSYPVVSYLAKSFGTQLSQFVPKLKLYVFHVKIVLSKVGFLL